jgi:threonine/homoserine/homoserine lactone efflux protein
MGAFLAGMALGLLLCISIGPTFFKLIEVSVRKGFNVAIYFLSGVFLSDLIIISLVVFNASFLVIGQTYRPIILKTGGIIFVAMALLKIFRTIKIKKNLKLPAISFSGSFLNGFILNTFNPSVFIFWIAACALAFDNYEENFYNVIFYFAGALFTTLITDLAKAYFSHRFTKNLLDKYEKVLGYSTAAIYLIVGIRLLV